MHRLDASDYRRVGPLLSDLTAYNVSIDAVLEGCNPGEVYVDDAAAAQLALLTGPEGTYLGGTSPTADHIAALKALVNDLMVQQDVELLWLVCAPGWAQHLAQILPRPPLSQARQHYVCTVLALDWRVQVPQGYAVQPITQALLSRVDLEVPDHIYHWMDSNWGCTEDFLARGFGFVTEDQTQQRVVSWSLCDCSGGAACEIGIHTRPEYRRRGLAAITAAAAVEHALAQGFREVGWHCNTENIASAHTALKVGFVRERDYSQYVSFRSEAIHWAEAARMQAVQGNYAEAADGYVRADSAGEQPEWGRYIPFYAACMFARLGDEAAAFHWLRRALTRGFDDLDSLQCSEALAPLKTSANWAALIESIRREANSQ